jgi:hypothetical protein
MYEQWYQVINGLETLIRLEGNTGITPGIRVVDCVIVLEADNPKAAILLIVPNSAWRLRLSVWAQAAIMAVLEIST